MGNEMHKRITQSLFGIGLAVTFILNTYAVETKKSPKAETPSHAPTKKDIQDSMNKADQKKAQTEFKADQDKKRPKSDAEKKTENIPKEPTVKPIFKPGPGVEVVIPTK